MGHEDEVRLIAYCLWEGEVIRTESTLSTGLEPRLFGRSDRSQSQFTESSQSESKTAATTNAKVALTKKKSRR